MPRETTIPTRVVSEEIRSIDHHVGLFVRVIVGTGSVNDRGDFEFDPSQNFDVIEITDQPVVKGPLGVIVRPEITDYTELVSESPEWAPGKPGGTFRRQDLWRFIDRVRARRA